MRAAIPTAASSQPHHLVPLISAARIRRRVAELGQEIDDDYRGRPVTLVVVLKGAAIFAADLVRRLTVPVEIEFVWASSYGHATRSSGAVSVAAADGLDLRGREVIVVEDIVDTGLTCRTLIETLRRRAPASLSLCALLHKRVTETAIDIRYTGFDIPDRFVVGYGMDYAEMYRHLPDIRVLGFGPAPRA